MTYLLLSGVFLLAALAVAFLIGRGTSVRTCVLAGLCLIVLTIVFDNIMIAAGLFSYSDAHISGLRIGLVPIEDLAYPLAAVILLPALWNRVRRHNDR